MIGLTDKQRAILEFIIKFESLNHSPPTIGEIAASFNITDTTAFAHICALQKKGYLNRSRKARSIRLNPDCPVSKEYLRPISLPLYKDMNELRNSAPSGWIQIDSAIFGIETDKGIFAFKMQNNQLADCGIIEGDILIACETSPSANNGDIIILFPDSNSPGKIFKYISNRQKKLFFRGRTAKVIGLLRTFSS